VPHRDLRDLAQATDVALLRTRRHALSVALRAADSWHALWHTSPLCAPGPRVGSRSTRMLQRITIYEYERGLEYRKGRLRRPLDPGRYRIPTWTTKVRRAPGAEA